MTNGMSRSIVPVIRVAHALLKRQKPQGKRHASNAHNELDQRLDLHTSEYPNGKMANVLF